MIIIDETGNPTYVDAKNITFADTIKVSNKIILCIKYKDNLPLEASGVHRLVMKSLEEANQVIYQIERVN